ncbi:MAG TPA: M23 family metallopeptidase, partial [Myxococcota bacterium]|nr:M23 family metallopeptidase [Myxococcota bacterium]
MSLGFALVHPQRLRAALDESFPDKVGWDDGADVVLAGAGIDIGDDPLSGFLAQLRAEALDLLGQLQGLVLPGGPWQPLMSIFEGQTDGVADWLRRIGGFLADLDPLHLKATLGGQVDALFAHFPGFDLSTLDDRLRRIAQQALSVLRNPLLSGRDDNAAHRAYRVAAMLLARLEPLLRQLDAGLPAVDLRAAFSAWLLAAIDQLPTALLSGVAQIGAILRDDVAGVAEAALSLSLSVSVGPSGLVSGTPTHRDDGDPQPFAKGSALWVVDLVTSGVALFWSIWGFQRARGIKRPTEWIEFLLATAWHLFRDAIRLFVQPDWLSASSSGFVRMLFSEWGDLFVRLFLMIIGSIEDMVAWSNFVMGFGNRFLKWSLLELQPRLVYLFARSVWYLRSWHDDASKATRGDPKFVRALWAGWAPALVVVALMGLLQSGESYDLQSFFKKDHEGASASLILVLVFQLAASIFVPWAILGEHPFRKYSYERFDFIALVVAVFVITFIGVETLGATNVGETAANVLRVILYILFGLPLIIIPIAQAASSPPGKGEVPWYEVIGAIEGWIIAVLGGLGLGLLTFMSWWFVRSDGADATDDFVGLDVETSPYRLPYPKGDMWFCGQGFHGVFSHTWPSGRNPAWKESKKSPPGSYASDNLFAYDFNNAYGKPACAARDGFVREVTIDYEDGGGDANSVKVQHWGWAAGHDPGTELERELTYATYHHLAKQQARCGVGQYAQQGYNLAAIDDTGISALNHLHFQVSADVPWRREEPPDSGTFKTDGRKYSVPVLFRDEDARGFRSFGHIDGKPISLAYYISENVGGPDDAVTTTPLTQPLDAKALAAETGG